MRVLIAGGGIGGLVAGLCLHRVGIEVAIFESVEEFRPLGVGINLLPHAVRVLVNLGLQARLEETAIATAELGYYTKWGRLIWCEPRGRAAGYRWPQYSIHRGQLQMLLLEAVRERLGWASVHTGHHLASFADHGQQVTATFVNRQGGAVVAQRTGDVLVGADGIHSELRRHFYPDEGPPHCSGHLLWRGVTDAAPFLTGRSMIMAGHAGQKFVAYPICSRMAARGRSLINWVAELQVEGAALARRDWNRRVEKSKFVPAFASWRFDWLDIPALIDGAAEVFEFPMADRDPLPRWSFGRVTLLGDAAHPMYPIGSNGASQAILDAETLAEVLVSVGLTQGAAQALQVYEEARLGPTEAVVRSNRRMGPEVVLQLAEERAPHGFERLEDVIPHQELEEIAQRYKVLAGFDRERLEASVRPAVNE
jgi:2-polyprenyl-6-methoxyphenol hydroxylase-like FAD-dependent oxidoreductase